MKIIRGKGQNRLAKMSSKHFLTENNKLLEKKYLAES